MSVASTPLSDQPVAGASPRKLTLLQRIDLFFRFFFGILVTPTFVGAACYTAQYQLVVVLFLTLGVITVLGSGRHLLERYPVAGRVRIVGGVLRLTSDLDAFYRAHPPRFFLFYLVWPVYALLGSIVSSAVRREVMLHLRLVFIIVLLILIELVTSYGRIYPPYLALRDVEAVLFAQFFVVLQLCLLYLIPMVTTVELMGVAGKRKTLRAFVALSLLFGIPAGYLGVRRSADHILWLDGVRLVKRLGKPDFRRDLLEETAMYLDWTAAHGKFDDASDTPEVVSTSEFRRVIRGLLSGSEERALSIVGIRLSDGVWTALRLQVGTAPVLLCFRSPTGEMFRRALDVPNAVWLHFALGTESFGAKTALHIGGYGLMDDLFH